MTCRLQHLIDFHHFPRDTDLSRMHLLRHTPQPRPERSFQKAAPKQGRHNSTPTNSADNMRHSKRDHSEVALKEDKDEADSIQGMNEGTSLALGASEDVDMLTDGMSRLSAAHASSVPEQIGFGRRGRGGMMRGRRAGGRRGQGRGRHKLETG